MKSDALENELLPLSRSVTMTNEKTDHTKEDKTAEKAKTSPRGMAPDKAHVTGKTTGTQPDVNTEETFDNSPNNAGSTGNRKLK